MPKPVTAAAREDSSSPPAEKLEWGATVSSTTATDSDASLLRTTYPTKRVTSTGTVNIRASVRRSRRNCCKMRRKMAKILAQLTCGLSIVKEGFLQGGR